MNLIDTLIWVWKVPYASLTSKFLKEIQCGFKNLLFEESYKFLMCLSSLGINSILIFRNFDESNRAIFNHPTGGLVKSLLFWHRIVRMFNKFMVHAWSWHGGLSLEVFYIGALRSKLILACQEGLKWVFPPLHLYRIYFVQTYKNRKYCMQNNQNLTKSLDEWKDNSNVEGKKSFSWRRMSLHKRGFLHRCVMVYWYHQ